MTINLAPPTEKQIKARNKVIAKGKKEAKKRRRARNCSDDIMRSRMGADYDYYREVKKRVKRSEFLWELSWPVIFLAGMMTCNYTIGVGFWTILLVMWPVMIVRNAVKNWHLKRVRNIADAELRLLGGMGGFTKRG